MKRCKHFKSNGEVVDGCGFQGDVDGHTCKCGGMLRSLLVEARIAETDSALERARVVGLLDAWAAGDPPFREWAMQMGHCEPDTCRLTYMRIGGERNIKFDAETPDAARAAAAKAIESGEL